MKEFLIKKYGGLPLWAWGLAGVAGVGIGLYFYSRNKSNTNTTAPASTTSGSTGDNSTASTTDASVGTTGYGDYSAVGPNAGGANGTGTTINIGTPATNPSNWLTTLVLTSSGPVPLYDSAGTAGSSTLGNQIGTIPANSTIQATGPELTGAWNQPNGSELWYPVVYNGVAGFVNAYYVANASTQMQNSPVPTPVVNPTTPTTGTTAAIKGKTFKTTKAGSLEDNPRGKVLATVPSGASITVLANTPKPDPQKGSTKKYYWVSYGSKKGWFGDDNFTVS